MNKALSMISYPLTLWKSKKPESQKAFYQSLARKLKTKLENWRKYKPLRSTIDDLFKLAKKSFLLEKVHCYTTKSVKKFLVECTFSRHCYCARIQQEREHTTPCRMVECQAP